MQNPAETRTTHTCTCGATYTLPAKIKRASFGRCLFCITGLTRKAVKRG